MITESNWITVYLERKNAMKKLFAAILLVLSVVLLVSCSGDGDSTTNGNDETKNPVSSEIDALGFVLTENAEGTYSVTDYIGSATNVTLPASYNTIAVTAIDSYAFQNCTTLLNVTIPEGITAIGENAFDGCSNLMRVTIPASVKKISESAFLNCEKLVQITNLSAVTLSFLPENQGLEIRTSADVAFKNYLQTYTDKDGNVLVVYDKNGIITYAVNETVGEETEVTVYLLAYKGDAKEVDLSKYTYVDVIAPRAFYQNTALTSVILPEDVTVIEEDAFKGCTNLKTVRFADEDNLSMINRSAFEGCTALASIDLPATVTHIGVAAFKDCVALTSVDVPATVTRIGEECFFGCTALKTVSFEDGSALESIGASAFASCKAMKDIVLPESLQNIALGALKDCSALTSITLPFIGEAANSIDNTHFGYIFGATDWKDNAKFVPTTLKTVIIKDYASVLSVDNLPTQTTVIGKHAFDGCTALTSIEVSPCVASIGKDAFAGCTALTDLTYKALTFEVEVGVDENGDAVTETVEIPSQLKNIESGAFKGCVGLTKIEIPSNVKKIASGAYEGCTNAKGIYISDIGAWCAIAFEDDDANPLTFVHDLYLNGTTTPITDLIIPENTESISASTFSGLTGIKSILIPLSMKTIADFAFEDCTKLEKLYYAGTAETWTDLLKIKDSEGNEIGTRNNKDLASAVIYYYSETKPTLEGNYWYFDKDGNITVWTASSESGGATDDTPDAPSTDDSQPDGVVVGNLIFELNSKGNAYTVIGYKGKLNNLVIPETYEGIAVTGIGDNAFYQCTTLTSIEIPASITSISYEAFRGCTALKNVVFAAGTKTIKLWAFGYCSSLESITIPASVTAIEDYAFHGNTALKSIYYGGTEAQWADVTINRSNEALTAATVYFQ